MKWKHKETILQNRRQLTQYPKVSTSSHISKENSNMTEKLDYAKDRILNQGTKNDHLILGAIWPYLQEKKS